MNPDFLYGPCLPAVRSIEPLEENFIPSSLQRLDKSSAAYLDHYLRSAPGLKIQNTIQRQATILWIMVENCDIFFALEELISAESGEYLMPYFRSNKINEIMPEGKTGRLGHPSLLTSEKKARIAGEIQYTPDSPTGWTLNRNSGRYGRRSHQTLEHLKAAHQIFTRFGLHIDVDVI